MLLLDGEALVAEARAGDPAVSPPTPPTFAEAADAARALSGLGAPGVRRVLRLRHPAGGRRPRDPRRARRRSRRRPRRHDLGREGRAARDRVGRDRLSRRLLPPRRRPGEPLLARITARVDRLPGEGERCVVAGWPLDDDGRKRHAATALYGEDGVPIAVSRQLWIAPRGDGSRRPAEGVTAGFPASGSGRQVTPRGVLAASAAHEQPAVVVVGGEEVDGDRLADRRPGRELERETELADAPLLHDADRLRDPRAPAPRRRPGPSGRPPGSPVSSKTPRPAASTRASRSQTMKPVDGSGVVVLEQLEDEPEPAAPALQRIRAREPLEAVDVDRAVLAVRADVDGHGSIVGTCRRPTADKAHSDDDRAAHSLASERGAGRAGDDHGLRALARAARVASTCRTTRASGSGR